MEKMNTPLFWMNETTGRMKEIVIKFFSEDQDLGRYEREILKHYMIPWVQAAIQNPYGNDEYRKNLTLMINRIQRAESKQELKDLNMELLSEFCIDLF